MRTTKEILREMEAVQKQVSELHKKNAELMAELIKSAEMEFEERAGVKRGEPIKTKKGVTYFYDGFRKSAYGSMIYVLCHPSKKDGTPSLRNEYLTPEDFGVRMNTNTILL